VQAQKKFLHVVAEETSRMTGGRETVVSKARKTEMTKLAQEATDTFVEAQKKLMDVAARQVHVSLKAAGTTAKMMPTVPYREIPDLTREGFRSFVEAEKAVIESVTRRPGPKKTVKATARKRPRSTKPRVIPVKA